ncbi:MAG: cell division topological specificity factor MinE [Candidatus Caenarcaniphilales bacterium]|nr:cell division topological specificity factor MinE [Candidatus Caenarcaniphilales bacterium]
MFTAVKNLFSKISGQADDKSGSTAASRMRLMLTHDRQEVAPGVMNQMKQEILQVISKYFDIDPNEAEFIIQANHVDAESIFSSKVPLLKGAKLRPEHMNSSQEAK